MSRRIRPFTADDIPAALDLCRAAGWNQLHEDWKRLVEYEPDGCFAAEADGQLVGTVTTTCYAAELAWIGMMLVHEDYRRQGIATELINASFDYLRDRQVECIKLDATPDGEHLYRQLGFRVEWSFHRWAREAAGAASVASANAALAEPAATMDRSSLQLDRVAFLADRSRWLERLAGGSRVCVREGGFGMLRAGHLASYLGPIVAKDPATAAEIIDELLRQSTAAKTFWDVMNPRAAEIAGSLGFEPVRDLTRMWAGSKLVSPPMSLQYAISDPGTG